MTRFRKNKFGGIFELIIGVGTKNGPAIPEKSAKLKIIFFCHLDEKKQATWF